MRTGKLPGVLGAWEDVVGVPGSVVPVVMVVLMVVLSDVGATGGRAGRTGKSALLHLAELQHSTRQREK